MAEGIAGRVSWLLRRLLVAFGAAVLLWMGLGAPRPVHALHRATWLTVDGVRLRALEAGRGDTTLIFLHGFGESLLAWRLILDRFTPRYRVLAIDLPGHGLSDKPEGPYDVPAQVALLSHLVEQHTTGPVVLVGHSFGGELAAGVALALPQRVRAAVLLAPAGDGINPMLTDSSGVTIPPAAWVASALSAVLPMHDSAWLREPPGAPDVPDSAVQRAARDILRQVDFSAIGERFRDLHQPVLLIWGRQDPTVPYRIGEQVAAMLPCHRLVSVNALHRPHQSLPDTVAAEMLRFLAAPGCG